ncbi:uncharacterized protein LOC110630227 isoform X3 [Manihot esculenta]|uniref:uncharacterized protein LOC110630227 isoform X3 n=1 Tax=Manihot esculenta TaxID=3983 RepID=UPI000B5D36AE|nr:uncharacterized protein LOC110630227 isoform X3 [Manihot esculenta]
MAEYASSTSCVKLHMRTSCLREKSYLIRNSYFRTPQRKYSHGSCRVLQNPPVNNTCSIGLSNFKANPGNRETSLRRSCLGALEDPDGAAASDLVSISDQLLLMASIALTHIAGVIPIVRPNLTSGRNITDHSSVLDSTMSSVKEKLLVSLHAIEHNINLGNRLLEIDEQRAKQPLSLYAISEGPKLRLLWASFKQLEDEVNNVFGDSEDFNLDDWLTIFPEIIKKSCNCMYIAWLVEELRLRNKKLDEELLSLMIQKLKGDETVLQTIRKSSKEDLYAELLYFLRFGSLSRKSCCYDQSFFTLHGDVILEDLVITLADGIASVYLELISVDGNLSNEMNNLGMDMCDMSTRALQRLRNEVALNQWLYQNVEAVVSMYEDRFDLCILQSTVIEEPRQNQTKNSSWWKNLTERNLTERKYGTVPSSFNYIFIGQLSMPVKRTNELRALTGWRYYFSLCLEFLDISMPLIRAIIDKVSNAVSFFLVSLIGRSLGLIYSGIRQSLRWK